MKLLILVYSFILTVTGSAIDQITESPRPKNALQTANISPEILKELKDFENLIPQAVIDEIVAVHYVIDGNFRTALKYLRSKDFSQLQQQLLTIPEIINVLDFLHATTVNATTMHMGATNFKAVLERASLDDDTDNRIDKMTTIAAATSKTVISSTQEATTKAQSKRPQHRMKFNDNDIDVNSEVAGKFIEQPPQLRFVLLDDSKVKTKEYVVVPLAAHNDKDISASSHSLGTFTSFVEEVLEYLPQSKYENMIKDKCRKNPKFAEFYKALKSPEFKPLVEEAMKTPNILKIISNLNAEDIDVKSLEPIVFKVISWGPNV